VAIDPFRPHTAYAATWFSFFQGSFLRTTDGGRTWAPIDTGLDGSQALTVLPNPVVRGTLYAGTELGGAFMSTDSGASWTAMDHGLSSHAVRSLAVDASGHWLFAGTCGGVFQTSLP
jgi:photosystem II stability/assembly factor-like uncharacterized protein